MKPALWAALLGLAVPLQPAAAEISAAQHLPSAPLTIRTGKATLRYRVEVARTPEQQEIGLMFRKSMARDRGMVFPMQPSRPASFWMHNTFIPLDIIFVRADGRISSIAAEAPPLTDRPTLDSGEPVAAVLELAGGEAKRAGIRPGDRVRW